jgi:hypothetical protein
VTAVGSTGVAPGGCLADFLPEHRRRFLKWALYTFE